MILLSGIHFDWPSRKEGGLFKRRNTGATTRNDGGYGKNSFSVFPGLKKIKKFLLTKKTEYKRIYFNVSLLKGSANDGQRQFLWILV